MESLCSIIRKCITWWTLRCDIRKLSLYLILKRQLVKKRDILVAYWQSIVQMIVTTDGRVFFFFVKNWVVFHSCQDGFLCLTINHVTRDKLFLLGFNAYRAKLIGYYSLDIEMKVFLGGISAYWSSGILALIFIILLREEKKKRNWECSIIRVVFFFFFFFLLLLLVDVESVKRSW